MVAQCKSAWEESTSLKIDFDSSSITNIVFCGMGASIYGAIVSKSLEGIEMNYPSEIISDYHLPAYVNENSLVVLTSYSGSTEEVLSCAEEAKAKNAKMLILTKGGTLSQFALENKIPCYIFDGTDNPSGVPRLGNGYSILGLLGLLNKTNIISVGEKRMENALLRLAEKKADLKAMAEDHLPFVTNKIPVIIAAEHLSGNALIFRNQFNETSKTFSTHFIVPDLNHHLLEGLQFPKEHPLHFIILNSPNYSPKIKRRLELTVEILKNNNHTFHECLSSGQTIYDDFLEMLLYSNYLTLFLALAYNQNPAGNPFVDWFKGNLSS